MEKTMQLTHMDEQNRPRMVDVSDKGISDRLARATGRIKLAPETVALIAESKIKKGNVLTTAELAGVQAGKQTANLIPLCHTLLLTKVSVTAILVVDGVEVTSEVKCTGKTGVEMEALTAVSVALLTIYDMCKAVDKSMKIGDITLLEKTKSEEI
jgi:cyclic pyranopterin monophosphate synthase